ncbi:MAG: T9SS C-terminal target domain-containing protein, partial [Chitinophagia bacterium]|nr:T9SS C-terminal target domain-containing protein [Chitinophagia bacterium]
NRELTISCPPGITGWQFSLTDFTGRVQLQYSGRNAEERINLQHLLPGLYFYQFTSNGQTFKRGTIVKTGG